jgi:hypothetical protein
MNKSTYFGKKNAGALGLGVTALVTAAIMFRACGPSGGQDHPQQCPPAPVCAPAPVKGDNRCEVDKGEHDPSSPTFDPASCGYCGDGIAQPWEVRAPGDEPAQPLPAGVRPVVCPADLACGNGQVDRDVEFAVLTPAQQGSDIYKYDVLRYTETCRQNDSRPGVTYCAADCGNEASPRPHAGGASSGHRTPHPEGTGVPAVVAPPPSSAQCPGEVAARLASRAASNLMGNPGQARSAAGAPDGVGVRATVRFSVSNGVANTSGISVTCVGDGCHSGSLPAGNVNLSAVPLGYEGSCSGSVTVNIPPG